MISALKSAAVFLAIPLALAMFGRPELALGWASTIAPPIYDAFALAISAVLFIVFGLVRLRPFSFLAFGLVAAVAVVLQRLWSMDFDLASLPLHVLQTTFLVASNFVPFAAIQFVLALIQLAFALVIRQRRI